MMQVWKPWLGMGMGAFFMAATAWAQGDIVDTAFAPCGAGTCRAR